MLDYQNVVNLFFTDVITEKLRSVMFVFDYQRYGNALIKITTWFMLQILNFDYQLN